MYQYRSSVVYLCPLPQLKLEGSVTSLESVSVKMGLQADTVK